MKKKHPTILLEIGKHKTAIVGYPKKQIPKIVKKVTKRNLKKMKKTV